ncbi:MAG: hypothetical protein LC642_01550 [Verrucomicrobiaceae bacterium]|nr:hypothetical protein [Verrucomicrobiaceae bacterium]
MPYIDQFLSVIVEQGGSDLHIGEGQPPKMRRHGDVMPIREEAITRDEAAGMLSEICGAQSWKLFEERGDLDFAYEMDERSRFRCNFLKQTNGYGAVFRLIPTKIATLEQLGIPPVVKLHKRKLFAAHCDDRGAHRVRAREQAQHHYAARSAGGLRLVSRWP